MRFGGMLGIALMMVALFGEALGQGGATGAIEGTVQDQSGAVVSGAEVRIVDQDTGVLARTTKSDAAGSFNSPLLTVGTYSVSVKGAGFGEATYKNVVVRVTETTRMIAKLSPQSVQQDIQVEAQVQTVETSSAATGEAIEANTISPSLPAPRAN
jgi:hypothetical protein